MTDTAKPLPLKEDRDPMRWAREFNKAAFGPDVDSLDEGFLISWFANAMMCGEDTYRQRQKKADKPQAPTSAREALERHCKFKGPGACPICGTRALAAALPQDKPTDVWARTALEPQGEAGVPEGYVPVPMEPTEEMLRAGWNAYLDDMAGGLNRFAITYRAMLSARPAAKVKP